MNSFYRGFEPLFDGGHKRLFSQHSKSSGLGENLTLTKITSPPQIGSNNSRRHRMPSGTVKWFNDAKGFGFIEPDGGGPDAFAHFSAIQAEGYKTLSEGARVTFELTKGDKGLMAANIRAENIAEDALPASTGENQTS
ncbi:cold-shock protein [Limnohabitans sp. T6-5]|uniref:cold-shock protein n=1 Tax=Limnohabitans sp. T6-5 TaxID=1100724 RepID=UPI002712051B|nr:cold-shock protein [Limnohabitans sp. T6-5]